MLKKLKNPLQQNNEGIYPLTTADQILRPNGEKEALFNEDGASNLTSKDIKDFDDKIQEVIDTLGGAMHFIGTVDSMPPDPDDYGAGDVVTYEKKEYVKSADNYWIELGDEGSYAIKGSIKNSDISDDAAIDQSKIDGLTDALSALPEATMAATAAAAEATTAAANANAKADYIGNATFTAHNVEPGGTATVTKTDKDGHAHFDFGLVKGDPGNIAGNAPSADKLLHARQINRVDFDGTKDITVPRIVAQEIPDNNNVDLNTLLVWELNNLTNQNTIEYYTARSGAASNNVQNKPVDTDEGFSLTVRTLRYLGTDVAVMQEYASAKYKCVYRRFYRQNNHEGWTDWERIATTADIDGKFVSSVWGVLPDDKGDVRPKVGGRNYILDSATPYIFSLPSSGQRTANMARCSSMEVRDSLYGKTITFTADYDSNITAGRVVLAVTNSYQEVFAFNSVAKGSITKTITLKVPSTYNNQSPYILYLQANIATGATGSVTLSNMKLELGEVPTDWSPAPEDKQDKIDIIGGTNLLGGTDWSTFSRNQNEANWENNVWTSYGSAVKSATVESANGKFGLGIKNFLNITASDTGVSYGAVQYNVPVKAGDHYTISVDAMTDAAHFEVVFSLDPFHFISSQDARKIERNGYTTYIFDYTVLDTDIIDGKTMVAIKCDRGNGTYIQIGGVKMEHGTVATDWSPSPRDAVQTNLTINGKPLTNNIALTASDVGALPSSGTAESAKKLLNARNINSLSFDGTKDISIIKFATMEIPQTQWASPNSQSPYTGLATCANVTQENFVLAYPQLTNIDEYNRFTKYKIIVSNQSEGMLELKAYGEMPTEPLNFTILTIEGIGAGIINCFSGEVGTALEKGISEAKQSAESAFELADSLLTDVEKLTNWTIQDSGKYVKIDEEGDLVPDDLDARLQQMQNEINELKAQLNL